MSKTYIDYIYRNPDVALDTASFPGNLPFVQELRLEFDSPVTFFVGENGSGKSTLLEAIAVVAGFPISGGSTNETDADFQATEASSLADSIRIGFHTTPRDGFFFRAEMQSQFASLLDLRKSDPAFCGDPRRDPYQRYGGQSLHRMSHGEAFLAVMKNRFNKGLFLLDEPESALSPQRQLTLLAIMHDLVKTGRTQFVIATHSAILLTYPGAKILSFDSGELNAIRLEETKHYQITRGILTSPGSYWKHLVGPGDDGEAGNSKTGANK